MTTMAKISKGFIEQFKSITGVHLSVTTAIDNDLQAESATENGKEHELSVNTANELNSESSIADGEHELSLVTAVDDEESKVNQSKIKGIRRFSMEFNSAVFLLLVSLIFLATAISIHLFDLYDTLFAKVFKFTLILHIVFIVRKHWLKIAILAVLLLSLDGYISENFNSDIFSLVGDFYVSSVDQLVR